MFPIGDDNSGERTFPIVTYGLIALNFLFFFVELGGGEHFIQQWSVVPKELIAMAAKYGVTPQFLIYVIANDFCSNPPDYLLLSSDCALDDFVLRSISSARAE